MKYLISSVLKFYESTCPPLIESLIDSGVSTENIFIVVGDCPEDNINVPQFHNVQVRTVKYNSFDLTSMIYLVEHPDEFDDEFYFLLHDTSIVGPDFKKLVEEFDPTMPIKPFRVRVACNLGMYTKTRIMENKEFLLRSKFYPTNTQQLKDAKGYFVAHEDAVFNNPGHHARVQHVYYGGDVEQSYKIIPFDDVLKVMNKEIYVKYFEHFKNSTIERRIEYYPSMDMYKIKANWGQSVDWQVEL